MFLFAHLHTSQPDIPGDLKRLCKGLRIGVFPPIDTNQKRLRSAPALGPHCQKPGFDKVIASVIKNMWLMLYFPVSKNDKGNIEPTPRGVSKVVVRLMSTMTEMDDTQSLDGR